MSGPTNNEALVTIIETFLREEETNVRYRGAHDFLDRTRMVIATDSSGSIYYNTDKRNNRSRRGNTANLAIHNLGEDRTAFHAWLGKSETAKKMYTFITSGGRTYSEELEGQLNGIFSKEAIQQQEAAQYSKIGLEFLDDG